MADLRINLSTHPTRFSSINAKLSLDKSVNFIFGKNGTGKTTITDELKEQFSGSYNVCIFKDFEGIAENGRLNAVSLGTENAEIQEKIDSLDSKIAVIGKDIEKPEDRTENLYTKAASAKKSSDNQAAKIDKFYMASARQIKSQSNPTIASPSYDKNAFKNELGGAKSLTDQEVASHKAVIKADKKLSVLRAALPVIDLGAYLKSTNEVLGASVKQPASIPELKDNPQKQQFAKTGLEIHQHEQGEVCAFCGNEISESRWIALGNYFNNEVKALELRIEAGKAKIQGELKKLDDIKDIDTSAYYGKYTEQIKQLNLTLRLQKAEHKDYLEKLGKALSEKKSSLFVKTDPLELDAPEDFGSLQKEHAQLVDDNNAFSKDLTNEQNKSKDALRYHEIQKSLDAFKYSAESASLTTLNELNRVARDSLKDRRTELTIKQRERIDLISQTKNEKKIAIKINKLLKNMGVASFELELINDKDEKQKGQYQIKGHDGNVRPITALSKGEKNIIAFLYFIFDLERTDGDSRPKIVVLDDPMTSNDDTMQYLMIGEIQRFYKGLKGDDFFILLTHNVHFYLNVRPDEKIMFKAKDEDGNDIEISRYKKYGNFRLMSDGKLTSIFEITKGKQDFKTNYESLWKELVFLYEADAPDLMFNPCRKICETYTHFMKIDTPLFYGENRSAKKLFDVNQHAIDDLEAEQNGKTRDEVKNILQELFKSAGAKEHFNSHWKGNV